MSIEQLIQNLITSIDALAQAITEARSAVGSGPGLTVPSFLRPRIPGGAEALCAMPPDTEAEPEADEEPPVAAEVLLAHARKTVARLIAGDKAKQGLVTKAVAATIAEHTPDGAGKCTDVPADRRNACMAALDAVSI